MQTKQNAIELLKLSQLEKKDIQVDLDLAIKQLKVATLLWSTVERDQSREIAKSIWDTISRVPIVLKTPGYTSVCTKQELRTPDDFVIWTKNNMWGSVLSLLIIIDETAKKIRLLEFNRPLNRLIRALRAVFAHSVLKRVWCFKQEDIDKGIIKVQFKNFTVKIDPEVCNGKDFDSSILGGDAVWIMIAEELIRILQQP